MKKILLIVLCAVIGLSAGSWVVRHQQPQPEEDSFKDGHVIARHVGISVSNTAAVKELIRQLPFSEALAGIAINETHVSLTYQASEEERIEWTGGKSGQDRSIFLDSRLAKVIMHHTLALFLSVSDLTELQITYRDPAKSVSFEVDRPRVEAYTPPDIKRASSSADRFNRVVAEDYVLVDSRRAVFFEKFSDALQIKP